MKIFDITLPLSEKTIIYPHNPKFVATSKDLGRSYISEIKLGTHSGTHIDAPSHVFKGKKRVGDLDLRKMIGPCRVLDVTRAKTSITIDDLKSFNIRKGERILVKTSNSKKGFKRFCSNYIYLNGDAADWLAKRRIALFAIDYLSVKQMGSDDVRGHTSLLKKNIILIEGVDLSKVKAGKYELVALPLRLEKLEASPARVVLLQK